MSVVYLRRPIQYRCYECDAVFGESELPKHEHCGEPEECPVCGREVQQHESECPMCPRAA